MSCSDCKIDYLMQKTELLETFMRLAVTSWHCSPTSLEVTNGQKQMARKIQEFEAARRGHACTHERDESGGEAEGSPRRSPGRPAKVRA